MICDRCKKQLNSNDKVFTAVGINLCEDCNTKSHGTVSLDMVFDKITEEKEKKKEEILKERIVELELSLVKANIPQGHCPYAYYKLNGEDPRNSKDFTCENCDQCKRDFFERMYKQIKRKVAEM